jgi:putative ATPase
VNRALVSRSRVFQLNALGDEDLAKAAAMALADKERGYGRWKVGFEEGALEHLVRVADGDARSLLNALELAVETSAEPWPPAEGAAVFVSMEAAEQSIQRRAVLYDRDGDYHYDAASALIKSLRGSDPDAALYWLSRMVYAGEEPRFIFRRLLISAAEDVGLADPAAIGVVESCAAAYERIGLPEGQFHLAQAALYLATAPKSNSSMGYFDALAAIEKERAEVPNHLKDASRDADGFGHGQGYQYPHAYRGHWTAQQYLPDALRGAVFYRPGAQGYEAGIRDEVLRRRDAQLAAYLAGEDGQEGGMRGESAWNARVSAGAAFALVRDEIMAALDLQRHENILILNGDDGLLAREASRVCTDGSLTLLVREEAALERLGYAYSDTEELLRPAMALCPRMSRLAACAQEAAGHGAFDAIAATRLLEYAGAEAASILASLSLAFGSARFALAERSAAAKGLLPALAAPRLGSELAEAFAAADARFYDTGGAGGFTPDALDALIKTAGLTLRSLKELKGSGQRRLGERDAEAWLKPDAAYGAAMEEAVGPEGRLALLDALKAAFKAGTVDWPWSWIIVAAEPKSGI